MKIRPYISLDIETTGLDINKAEVLQIAMVFDDGSSPVDELPRLSFLIKHKQITYGEPFAIQMNAWIFEELSKKDSSYKRLSIEEARQEMYNFISDAKEMTKTWDTTNGVRVGSIQIAGKNVASFDIPILNRFFSIKDMIDHRFIDVGSMAYNKFGYNPGFNKINKELGLSLITHDALDDAISTIKVIRKINNLDL